MAKRGLARPVAFLQPVLPGVLDSAFAGAATFAIGAYAATQLSPARLSLFGLIFSGWVVACLIPSQLALAPYRVAVLALPTVVRPRLRQNVRAAAPWLAIAALATAASGIPVAQRLPLAEVALTTVPAIGLALISPIQDHLRASLHSVGSHRAAAGTSACNVSVVVIVLWLALVRAVPTVGAAVPFTALLLGNAVSAALAVRLLRSSAPQAPVLQAHPAAQRVRLLLSDGVVLVGTYVSTAYIVHALGVDAASALERARVLASPLVVVIGGVSTFTLPSAIRAVSTGRSSLAPIRTFMALVGTGAGLYGAILLVLGSLTTSIGGPLPLALARLLSLALDGACAPFSALAFTRGRSGRWLLVTAASSASFLVALVLLTPVFGVYAVPLATAVGAAGRLVFGMTTETRAVRAAPTPRVR